MVKLVHFKRTTKPAAFLSHLFCKSSKLTYRLTDLYWLCWPLKGSQKSVLESLVEWNPAFTKISGTCLQQALEAGMQKSDQRTCFSWWVCPLATMAAAQQTQIRVSERQSNTSHTKCQCLVHPHLPMLLICAFTTVLTGTDSLQKTDQPTKKTQTKPTSVYFSLSPQTLGTGKSFSSDWNYRTRYCNSNTSWKFKDKTVYRWEK